MKPSRTSPVLVSSAVLAVGCLVISQIPGGPSVRSSLAQVTPPAEIRLSGIVRDFSSMHPDFDLAGSGFYAGTVEPTLAGGAPVASGAGYLVNSTWRDNGFRDIAPHLYGRGGRDVWTGVGVRVDGLLDLDNGSIDGIGVDAIVSTNSTDSGMLKISSDFVIDGDALAGPGGDPSSVIDNSGTVTGSIDAQTSAFTMPTIVVPDDSVVGPNTGSVEYASSTFVISDNMHVDDFRVKTNAIVEVSGNVTLLVAGEFRTETGGSIRVPDGSSLDIYVTGPKITIETKAAWSNPANTRMWVVGSPTFKLQTDSAFYGTIIAPDAALLIQTKAELFGSYIGSSLQVKTEGKIHITEPAGNGCVIVEDTAGTAGPAGSGGIASAASFAQWFADTPGTNQSGIHDITLTRDALGVYGYTDPEFYPIDSRLLGNEGEPHNANFTYAIRAQFTYEECGEQFVEFEGGDGMWLFIDDELVMDLGGVGFGSRQQFLDLDRLWLVDGQSYDLRLFFAQRSDPALSEFRLRTNLVLSTDRYLPAVTAQFD